MTDRSPAPMPAAFLGHGSPINTLERNRWTRAWRAFGAAIPRPRAVLVVSAHWRIGASALTAMPQPRTIHDFFGFPPELFAFRYPAPGDPELAAEIAELVRPIPVGLDRDSWGLDHGAWSVLAHLLPEADVPVLQLSIHGGRDDAYHLDLARRLAPLRKRGVLILGSGNVVHDLRRLDWSRPDAAYGWAVRFDDAVRASITSEPAQVAALRAHPDFANAAPTDEHFVPLLYLAGLADAAGSAARLLVAGCFGGSISMAAYTLGCELQAQSPNADGGDTPRSDLPPDATNL